MAGREEFDSGNYTINYVADDGLRIYVNGNQILSQWSELEKTGIANFTLSTTGEATIVIEHFEKTGNARLQVSIRKSAASSL